MTAPARILIVEDEPLIAMMLEDFLDILGKSHAGTVDSVAGALPLIADGGIDAAILDVNLRSGEKSFPIAHALAELDIPFVFATGGGDALPDGLASCPTLAKPFTMDAVARAVEAMG